MTADMPERIWIDRDHGKHPEDWNFTPDTAARGMFTAKQLERSKVEYVLASTHTRAMEALAEAEKAIRAQIEAHRLLCKAAGLSEHAHLDDTSQALAALTLIAAVGEKP